MRQKLLSLITYLFLIFSLIFTINAGYAAPNSIIELREVDKGTFNEYRYKITREFFKMKDIFEVDGIIDENSANRILNYAESGYKYLPDNLVNESNYNSLKTALRRGIKYPNNEAYFTAIKKALDSFSEKAEIEIITGKIEADPLIGNAPLTTTLRARLEDPSGTKISNSAYIWWMDVGGKRKVIGTKPSISYTFTQEGSFTVFLDVKSSHKNQNGYVDVLSYSGKVKIQVKEKIASVILRIGGKKIPSSDEIKFSPEEASYGLIFDAASSVPSTGTKFLKTSWDFGNGIKKSYSGSPRIQRVVYGREGEYDVTLRLQTNQLDDIEKRFKVFVHKPIASIKASQEQGYMGDKFSFQAVKHGSNKNLAYAWEIVDLEKDVIIFKKTGSLFNYSFKNKGRYSVKLRITDAAGNFDIDTKNVYINSRAPIANFVARTPLKHKPNEVFLDATSTVDPDYGDDGNLRYSWIIDGNRVNLERPNDDGSTGYYTFSTIGEHSVVLEVEDPDEISAVKKQSVLVSSILALDFATYPKVIQRDGVIRFIGNSPEAQFYEWDFGDGVKKGGSSDKINHVYTKSGIFTTKLTVRGKDNKSNTLSRQVYVGDSESPVAHIGISKNQGFEFVKEEGVCEGNDAYVISRKDNIIFSSQESIDTNGKTSGLEVSWKIGKDKYSKSPTRSATFDELGCAPVKLTVKSLKDKTTDSQTIWVNVKNVVPSISSLDISPVDINSDPVVVNLSALGAQDKDGVIQSYLWYYTTDADSEPQDFRVTKGPATTFVLPKIPGSYYFGVVLKDNNEEKVNSEDVIGKNSITLVGDNINTPLVDLRVGDSSVLIGDVVEFTAEAQDVLGKSIEKTSTFSWDFDGDGFYEKETDSGQVIYKYKKSGTFYPKVKVKHKGFSNTRTLTINVANKLVSDFSYISIGNKYVFLDKSKGTIDNHKWDLGDGTKKQNETSFIHSYDDKKSVHNVELTVAEGTKVKKSTQEVRKNFGNIIKGRKQGLNVFSYPAVNEDGIISIEEEESIFIYLGESKGDFKYYGIDYDIDVDSDINGGKDDDVDNLTRSSYENGDPDEIILNDKRNQTIRLFLLDEDLNTIDSKDITIEKTYIQELEAIDPNSIKFEGVTEGGKVKIEKLKTLVGKLEQEHRIKGMLYIQKLQENWGDDTEKTKTVIEFETFLVETGDERGNEIIDILESLLVEGEEDKSEKNIAFQALSALIPDEIQCKTTGSTCKETLVNKLEQIKASSDVEGNRAIGTEILKEIGEDSSMSTKEKNDFKAVLKVLVYSGLENIPEEEVKQVQEDDGKNSEGGEGEESGKLMSFLKSLGWWVLGIVGIIIVLMFIFWILDFLKNRKSGESFEDFVSDKTTDDVLGNISEEQTVDPLAPSIKDNSVKNDSVIEESSSGVFSAEDTINTPDTESVGSNKVTSSVPVSKDSSAKTDEVIPDWLAGETDNEKKEDSVNVSDDSSDSNEGQKQEEENVGISLSAPDEEETEEVSPQDIDGQKEVFNLEEETKVADDTPDWLQDSLTEKLPKKDVVDEEALLETEKKKVEENSAGEEDDEEKEEEPVIIEEVDEKIDLENDVPEWLQGIDTEASDSSTAGDVIQSSTETEVLSEDKKESSVEESPINRPENFAEKQVEQEKLSNENIQEEANKDGASPEIESTSDDNIPSWLKGSTIEDNNFEEGAEDKIDTNKVLEKEEKKGGSDDNIPDWLKGSLDENSSDEANAEESEVQKEGKAIKSSQPETTIKNTQGGEKSDKFVEKDRAKSQEDTVTLDDADVPDWLKGSLSDDGSSSEEKTPPQEGEESPKNTLKKKKEEKKTGDKADEKKEELWDDGMTIPDWLKTDNDK